MPLTHLSREQVQAMLPTSFVQQLDFVTACGNYGDPAMAPDAAEIFADLREASPRLDLTMHSNGGLRDAEFWKRLAGSLTSCTFGIDGLADTNHIYRRGVRWETLLRNVESFLEHGGRAIWDFIVFSHNEHQVDEARELATRLGFAEFQVKRTRRFFRASSGTMIASLPVLSRSGDVEYELRPPVSAEFVNPAVAELRDFVQEHSYEEYLNQTEIRCMAISEGSLYLSAEGLMFPCCYLGHIYQMSPTPASRQVEQLMEQATRGRTSLDALQRSIPEILNDRYFQEVVPAGWKPGPETGSRTQTCARICGDFTLWKSQYAPNAVINGSGVPAGSAMDNVSSSTAN